MNKLISITRGSSNCDHCGRPIKVLCAVLVDGVSKVVGSSCVEKFVPELLGQLNSKLRIFNASERRQKKLLAYQSLVEARRQEFEARLKGVSVVGDYLVKVVEPDLLHGLSALLLDDGFTATEDDYVFNAPNAEVYDAALESYEGLTPIEAVNPVNAEAVKFLENYTGRFDFLVSLRDQLKTKGYLSDAQLAGAAKCMAKQKPQAPAIELFGAVITLSKYFANHALIGQTGVNAPHFNFEVFKIFRETEKAFQLEMRVTGLATTHCSICGTMLTNESSIRIGIGPICRAKVGVESVEALNRKLEEKSVIFTAWIPKRAIKAAVNFPYEPKRKTKQSEESEAAGAIA